MGRLFLKVRFLLFGFGVFVFVSSFLVFVLFLSLLGRGERVSGARGSYGK